VSWTERWIAPNPEAIPLPHIPGAPSEQHGGVITITLSEKLDDFGVGSASLTGTADAALDRIAAIIEARAPSQRITCTGTTDGTGTAAFDLGLSRRRAVAVCGYLASQGVTPRLLHSDGLGKATPTAANPSLRRVIITIGG
jgi:outer membrane protein OmpA-like peptidoglycan-associated protein